MLPKPLPFALALALLAGCSHPAPSATPAPKPSSSPTIEPIHITGEGSNGQETTFTAMHGNRKAYFLRAPSYTGGRDSAGHGNGRFVQPHVEFYDERGRTMTSDAPQATIDENKKSLVMIGGVRTRTQDGSLLTCDRLRYNSQTELIHGDGHVVLTSSQGARFDGDVIDGDVRLEHASIRRLTK